MERVLPSPFSIAVLLTLITLACAFFLTSSEQSAFQHLTNILSYWQMGFWELLSFTMQMVLILLLGHTLALSPSFQKLIKLMVDQVKTGAQAALIVSLSTLLVSFLNWGLCLVFGAIMAKESAQKLKREGKPVNYGLLAAAGYCGMMAWHGGFSGSAPLKVAESDHFLAEQIGSISIQHTIFSSMNVIVWVLLLFCLPLLLYYLARKQPASTAIIPNPVQTKDQSVPQGTKKIDSNKIPAILLGGTMICLALISSFQSDGLSFINLNYINFLLFGLGILLHGSFYAFLRAIKEAIGGVSGIIIQFPLYAGIMGIMKHSGLVILISDFFVSISTPATLPIFTFISAAIVNTFVPSGGGQWAIQGPIIVEAANSLGVNLPKMIMALSYGDQLTNMLQPFWALPLLGITKLEAKDILPYSSILLLAGALIFMGSLFLF